MLQYAITAGRDGLQAGQENTESASYSGQRLVDQTVRLARQGITFLLVREKYLAAAALLDLTRRIVETIGSAVPGASVQILVAGRADIALAAGAHGVHLSSAPGELTPQQVRAVLPRAVVSVSCHTVEEVRRAHQQQASLALFAPVFGKWADGVEVVPGTGVDILRAACLAAPGLPVFALGGVTEANAPQCLAAGAAGIAGIRLFFRDR